MTTALAFDLFLDEHQAILDNEVKSHIENALNTTDNQKNHKVFSRLSVVKNDNSEIKTLKAKGIFDILENENLEIKISNPKASFFRNQNVKSQSQISENPENEINFLEQVRREMTKGYMSLLSNSI